MNVGFSRVPRSHVYGKWDVTCRTIDEGGPLKIGLQEQVRSHRKLLRLRVKVVSVTGKGGGKMPSDTISGDE